MTESGGQSLRASDRQDNREGTALPRRTRHFHGSTRLIHNGADSLHPASHRRRFLRIEMNQRQREVRAVLGEEIARAAALEQADLMAGA